jgi:hypothetical protein
MVVPFQNYGCLRQDGSPAWFSISMQGHGHHSPIAVETEREVTGTGLTEPEVFPPRRFLPRTVDRDVWILGRRLGEKQLTFTQGTKGYCTGWVRTFPKHGGVPFFSSAKN